MFFSILCAFLMILESVFDPSLFYVFFTLSIPLYLIFLSFQYSMFLLSLFGCLLQINLLRERQSELEATRKIETDANNELRQICLGLQNEVGLLCINLFLH